MSENKQTFQEALAFGQDGEREVAQQLIEHGFHVMTLYQFTSFVAPLIFAKEHNLPCPDLICWDDNGQIFFVDSKRKTRWVHWSGRTETGLNQKAFQKYSQLARETRTPFWLIFKHESEMPTGSYMININDAKYSMRPWDGYSPDGQYIGQPEYLFMSESLQQFNPDKLKTL